MTKAAREILLKAMGEGLAPLAASAAVVLEVSAVQASLLVALQSVIPATAVSSSDITVEGLEGLNLSSSKSTQAADAAVQRYVSELAAHLVVYDTLPQVASNGVAEDTWKYALATTETGQWKGTSILISFTCVYSLYYDLLLTTMP